MKIILSPAKTISKTCERFSSGFDFSNKTKEILKNAPEVLVSKDYCKAFYMYDGMCYKNIKREEFDDCDLEYIREHLIIISALYGVLKPFDLINPYRFDFIIKTKMGNLYNFWKDDIAKIILKDTDFIVNLASEEFSKTVKKYISEKQILDFEFFEKVDEKLKKQLFLEWQQYVQENPFAIPRFNTFELTAVNKRVKKINITPDKGTGWEEVELVADKGVAAK